jgi:hypothetical protein
LLGAAPQPTRKLARPNAATANTEPQPKRASGHDWRSTASNAASGPPHGSHRRRGGQTGQGADRRAAGAAPEIAKAIRAAQQLDADASFVLETPDSLTDLASLAFALHQAPLGNAVKAAAKTLGETLGKIKVYGENAKPWIIDMASAMPIRFLFTPWYKAEPIASF